MYTQISYRRLPVQCILLYLLQLSIITGKPVRSNKKEGVSKVK